MDFSRDKFAAAVAESSWRSILTLIEPSEQGLDLWMINPASMLVVDLLPGYHPFVDFFRGSIINRLAGGEIVDAVFLPMLYRFWKCQELAVFT